ncbi:MAG TPA: hypothetical protein VMZ29_16410 [Candidatus Bathyarchaeia archaeon]|nr:hypothetical protein [Candidatus Bathyarchaeia archaeon]
MTLVTTLCLNHELYFAVTWSSDSIGESRFNVCQEAKHKMFRFYGGTNKPYHFAWIYPFDEIEVIKNRIKKELTENPDFVDYNEYEYFIKNWQYLVKEGFYPEHFIRTPKKAFEDVILKKTLRLENYPLEKINELLTLEKEPYFSEPDYGDKNFIKIFQKQETEAKSRSKAIDNCKNIDRKYEEDFFDVVKSYLESPIQEQKWLGIKALTNYAITGIEDQERFYKIIYSCLKDKKYLIRTEIAELMYNYSFYYPNQAVNLIGKLFNTSEVNLMLYGILFTKRFHSLLETETNYLDHSEKKITFGKENYELLIPLFERALNYQNIFLESLLEKKSVWQQEKYWFLTKTVNFNELEIDEKILEYQRLLYCFSLISKPFIEFSYF